MTERLRGREGQQQRRRRLMAEPLCRHCRERGLVVASTEVDHIKPLSLGGTDDDSNVQCLCRPCHDMKTRADFGHRAPQQRIGLDGWPADAAHSWNNRSK